MRGVVGQVRQSSRSARCAGWASDGVRREPADQVAVFVDGEAAHYHHTVLPRGDVARHFKMPSLVEAGFSVDVPGFIFGRDPPPWYASSPSHRPGAASELRYRPEYDDGSQTLKLGRH